MTDKQIIIDGIKTSKEDFIDNFAIELTNRNIFEREQIGNKYFEIILAKEQECEELKDLADHNGRVCNERLDKIDELEHDINELNEQLDQLKAENEELTTINARLLGRLEVDETDTSLVFNLDKELRQKEKEFYTAIQKVVKLKQTLTEIKEIAYAHKKDESVWNPYRQLDKILQKISECEGNDE